MDDPPEKTAHPSCPYPGHTSPVPVPLTVFPEHPCVYLPDRTAAMRGFAIRKLEPSIYQAFMDAGFRRSGLLLYQPICRGCRQCLPLRLRVNQFRPNKSQRRCWAHNQDLVITENAPVPTEEKLELYQRYQNVWHGKDEPIDWHSFESFLYQSPVETAEFCYRDAVGKLLGVGICDVSPQALSTVYFYHDPDHSDRGLGTFSALYEIETAKRRGMTFYYLGFWVDGCQSMAYKAQYRPYEILEPDGNWRPAPVR
jgi:leucyl-tRNA---protein transferase